MSDLKPKPKASWSARLQILNSVIDEINILQNAKVEITGIDDAPRFVISKTGVTLILPNYSRRIEALEKRVYDLENA